MATLAGGHSHFRDDSAALARHAAQCATGPFVPELQRIVRARAPSMPVASMLTLAQGDAHDYKVMLRASALGARPMQVARMFPASGVRVSVAALALGLPLSIVVLQIALHQGIVIAPQIKPYVIGFAIAALLLAVASAATWIPARRAAFVVPAATMRSE